MLQARPTIKFCILPLLAPIFISGGKWRKGKCNSSLLIPRSTRDNRHFSRRCYVSAIRYTINVIATIMKSYVLNVLKPTNSIPSCCLVFIRSLSSCLIVYATPGHESYINLLRSRFLKTDKILN